ncbi:sodium/bile acid cotransporter 7-like [Epargyreus clarus]|uniref:sodium/bile acid cotransporter 7-like n=1 Tax=Epargyreus clarus TaxID=520877 RepID=UPI003C2E020C
MSVKESEIRSIEPVYSQIRSSSRYRSDYNVDMWGEVKKRWAVFGVLLCVAGAVAAPKLGAPGGPLHSEYLLYLPLSYIYYTIGCHYGPSVHTRWRLYVLTIFHAHVAAPALCLVTISALKDASLDYRVIEGAMLASAGTPCIWLPLSFHREGHTPALVAANYVAALIIVPLSHLILCGRFPVTPILGIVTTILSTIPPFALGTLRQPPPAARSKVSALLLLYSECCKLLRDSEGMLGVWDVLATLFLEVSWICTVVASSTLYLRCGLLNAAESKALLLTALPKSTHAGWEYSTTCKPTGLSQLPAVFLAPAQALILAAVYPEEVSNEKLPR